MEEIENLADDAEQYLLHGNGLDTGWRIEAIDDSHAN